MKSNEVEIRPNGEIYSLKYKKVMKCATHNKGYKRTEIDGKKYYVHRLVAQKYIPIPEKYIKAGFTFKDLEIDHIDGNHANNQVSNLRYCTKSENLKYMHEARRIKYRFKLIDLKEIEEEMENSV